MKKQTIFFTAALLTAGTLLTSCSNDDMTIEKPMEQTAQGVLNFTTTIAPKGGTATTSYPYPLSRFTLPSLPVYPTLTPGLPYPFDC